MAIAHDVTATAITLECRDQLRLLHAKRRQPMYVILADLVSEALAKEEASDSALEAKVKRIVQALEEYQRPPSASMAELAKTT